MPRKSRTDYRQQIDDSVTIAEHTNGMVSPERDRGRNAPRRVRAAEKRRVLLDLRAAGLREDAIAEQMTRMGFPISQPNVSRMLTRLLNEMAAQDQTDIEQARQLDLYRLDGVIQVLWPKVKKGDLKAVREYRMALAQRAELLGTKAPQRHEHSGSVDHRITPEDRVEMQRLEEAFLTGKKAEDQPDYDAEIPEADVLEEEMAALPSPTDLGVE